MNSILFFLILALLKILAVLPFGLLYKISDLTYYIIRYVIRYRYDLVIGNLKRSFPEKSDIGKTANDFYRHLSDCIFETIKLLYISDKQLDEHIKVVGSDLIEKLAEDGRSIILFLGHYGNWEWVQAVIRHYSRPAINAEIYRPPKNQVMCRIIERVRSRFDTIAIPQDRAVRHLLKMHQDGMQFVVGFISDQRPNSANLYHWTTFLNQDTAYPTGGEEIGSHLNAHFVYLSVEKICRGHYVMTFQEMQTDQYKEEKFPYTLRFLQLMEESIRKEPAYWLWSHNRWEFDREGNVIH